MVHKHSLCLLGGDDTSHLIDGRLGHTTYLAKEVLVEVGVLLLNGSFKIQYVSHHVLFPSSLIPSSGAELWLTNNSCLE